MKSRTELLTEFKSKLVCLQTNFADYCQLKIDIETLEETIISLDNELEDENTTLQKIERLQELEKNRKVIDEKKRALDELLKNRSHHSGNESIDLITLLTEIEELSTSINNDHSPLENLELESDILEIRLKDQFEDKKPESKYIEHLPIYTNYLTLKKAIQLNKIEQSEVNDVYQYEVLCNKEKHLKKLIPPLDSIDINERILLDKIDAIKDDILALQPKTPEFEVCKKKLKALENALSKCNKEYYEQRYELKLRKHQLLKASFHIASTEIIQRIQELEASIAICQNSNQYIKNVEATIALVIIEMRRLEKLKIQEDTTDQSRAIKKEHLDKTENVVDPIFQLFINAYYIIKNLFPNIQDRTDKILSYISLGTGKVINFLGIYYLYTNTKIPHRGIKMVNAVFNFFAAIVSIVITATKSNPYISGVIAFGSIILGLVKDIICTHQARIAVKKEKILYEEVNRKIPRNKIHLLPDEEIQSIMAPIDLEYHSDNINKLREQRFQEKRAVFFTAVNAFCSLSILASALITAIGSAFFPPLAITLISGFAVSAASYLTASTVFDLVDQFIFNTYLTQKISGNILTPAKRGIERTYNQLSTMVISLTLSNKSGLPVKKSRRMKTEIELDEPWALQNTEREEKSTPAPSSSIDTEVNRRPSFSAFQSL